MHVLEATNFSVLEWQADENLSIRELLKMPEGQFQRKKDDMVEYLDWKLDNPEKKYFTVRGQRLKQWLQQWIYRK